MTDYELTAAQAARAARHVEDHDWCPPGGTSTRRHRELANAGHAAVVAELRRRVDARSGELWMTVDPHLLTPEVRAGWHDDPRGEYYVAVGLELIHHLPEGQLRSFCFLAYTRRGLGDAVERRDEGIGGQYFEPPYAHDVVLRADHIMAWLDAHHRAFPVS